MALTSIIFDIPRLNELSGSGESLLIVVIARKLALLFRNDFAAINEDLEDGLKLERDADELAVTWGFGTEVEAFRKKIGPSTSV